MIKRVVGFSVGVGDDRLSIRCGKRVDFHSAKYSIYDFAAPALIKMISPSSTT